ncbi:hypothetical protein DFH06DRAFT_1143760 [Mycena polygramma]|nr:hypothetical protein DFH06DRAFT_1143760 [Mycena polygramma]
MSSERADGGEEQCPRVANRRHLPCQWGICPRWILDALKIRCILKNLPAGVQYLLILADGILEQGVAWYSVAFNYWAPKATERSRLPPISNQCSTNIWRVYTRPVADRPRLHHMGQSGKREFEQNKIPETHGPKHSLPAKSLHPKQNSRLGRQKGLAEPRIPAVGLEPTTLPTRATSSWRHRRPKLRSRSCNPTRTGVWQCRKLAAKQIQDRVYCKSEPGKWTKKKNREGPSAEVGLSSASALGWTGLGEPRVWTSTRRRRISVLMHLLILIILCSSRTRVHTPRSSQLHAALLTLFKAEQRGRVNLCQPRQFPPLFRRRGQFLRASTVIFVFRALYVSAPLSTESSRKLVDRKILCASILPLPLLLNDKMARWVPIGDLRCTAAFKCVSAVNRILGLAVIWRGRRGCKEKYFSLKVLCVSIFPAIARHVLSLSFSLSASTSVSGLLAAVVPNFTTTRLPPVSSAQQFCRCIAHLASLYRRAAFSTVLYINLSFSVHYDDAHIQAGLAWYCTILTSGF